MQVASRRHGPDTPSAAMAAGSAPRPQRPVALTHLETILVLRTAASLSADKDAEIANLRSALSATRSALDVVLASKSWQFTHPLRMLVSSLRRRLLQKDELVSAPPIAPPGLLLESIRPTAQTKSPGIDRALVLLTDTPRSTAALPEPAHESSSRRSWGFLNTSASVSTRSLNFSVNMAGGSHSRPGGKRPCA
jgi:hypothetical protein